MSNSDAMEEDEFEGSEMDEQDDDIQELEGELGEEEDEIQEVGEHDEDEVEEIEEHDDDDDDEVEEIEEHNEDKDGEEEEHGEDKDGEEEEIEEEDEQDDDVLEIDRENENGEQDEDEVEELDEDESLNSATSMEQRKTNEDDGAGSGEDKENTRSSFSSAGLEEIETDKNNAGLNKSDAKSKSGKDENSIISNKSSEKIDGLSKDENDSRDDSIGSEESRTSLRESNGEKKGEKTKSPNMNECTGKPAAMWKLVNGTSNEDGVSGKEDEDSESDSGTDDKNDEKNKNISQKKKDGDEPSKDSNEVEEVTVEKENGKKSSSNEGDVVEIKDDEDDDKDDKKENKEDSKTSEKGESNAAPVETRRRSLRNVAKRVEVETKTTPTKVEKRKATDSPKSKDKKQIKVEAKEPAKPAEPTTEPMSKEILEEAKFPPFLKDSITLGCYVPIRDKSANNIKLKEGESLLETPSITMPLLLKKPDLIDKNVQVAKPTVKEDPTKKNLYQIKPFFNSSVGEFLIGIGLSRVNEWYEKDMMKLKQRQLKRDVNNVDLDNSLQDHAAGYARSKQANEPFNFPMKKCEMCDFKTESELVMQGHLLVPHMTPRREFRCNFCTFITRDHKVILFHMEALHNRKGVLELPGQFFYDCPYCPFETNLKTRATSHINKCMKYFLSARNQLPPGDWENPTITAKPITLSDIKSYEMCVAAATAVARTNSQKALQQRGITTKVLQQPQRIIRPAPSQQRITTTSSLSLYQQIVSASLKESGHFGNNISKNRFQNQTITKTLPGKPEITVAVPGGQLYQVVNNGQVVPFLSHSGGSQLFIQQQPSNSGGPQPVALFPNLAATGSANMKNSVSIIPQSSTSAAVKRLPSSTSVIPTASPAALSKMQQNLPKLQGPYTTVQTASKSAYGNPMLPNTTFVICEICDGYLKDLEQLRTHMLWIHKVKIHPKMLSSRPPLNCQKCQWRFFTDQGLERHLLGAHGLVTSNMQELANKNQDGGRCTVCGRVYVCKLVSHMNQVHKATLKPAHLSYKCTVCSATFNLYKLFENHVYMFHSGSVKRSGDDANAAKKKLNSSPSVEMTVVPAKKSLSDVSMKVTVSPAPPARATLPPPMKLPAVEPIPSVTITPTNVIPEKKSENTSDRLKKNSVCAENAEKTAVINIIKKPGRFDDIVRCRYCEKLVRNISVHMKLRHTKRCRVKACHILKCEKCLGSFDGMVVLHTADFEENSDSEGAASVEEALPLVEAL